jgi:hypothetical protein
MVLVSFFPIVFAIWIGSSDNLVRHFARQTTIPFIWEVLCSDCDLMPCGLYGKGVSRHSSLAVIASFF